MGLLDSFKKNRESAVASVRAAVEEKNFANEFYYPERDQQGAASVVIRFLPQKDPNKAPFVSLFRHAFKGDDGKWVIADLCATTVGEECEICKHNSILWNTNDPIKQGIARERKRKKEYVCNILVVKDPRSPENEGKVFPYRFGPAIFNKIKNAVTPSYEDEPVLNPFDLWEGADFMLRIRKDAQSKQITYDDSKFAAPSTLCNGDEEKIVKILEQCIDLDKYVDKNLIIPQADLARRCANAYSKCIPSNNFATSYDGEQSVAAPAAPVFKEPSKPVVNAFEDTSSNVAQVVPSEDDPLAAFKSLVNEVQF